MFSVTPFMFLFFLELRDLSHSQQEDSNRGYQPEQSLLLRHPEPQTRTQGRMEKSYCMTLARIRNPRLLDTKHRYINHVRSILRLRVQ